MLDTVIAWINPPALVREVLIAMLMAAVAKFLYWRVERHWEKLTGYVSNRTKASRARQERAVEFYEANPYLLPLHASRVSFLQYSITFFSIVAVVILFEDQSLGMGNKFVSLETASRLHITFTVVMSLLGCCVLILQRSLAKLHDISRTIIVRARVAHEKLISNPKN